MNKKGTLTSRTLEKLGINPLRFRGDKAGPEPSGDTSTDADSDASSGSDHRTTDKPRKKKSFGLKEKLLGGAKHGTEDGRKRPSADKSKSVFYVDQRDSMVAVENNADKPLNNTMQEKKKTPPEGTIEYLVKNRETLESIAAHFDTTPSELKKINRLSSWMIFSEQILFVPDKHYKAVGQPVNACEVTTSQVTTSQVTTSQVTSSQVTTSQMTTSEVTSSEMTTGSLSPFGSPKDKPTMAVPIAKLADRPPAVVPGHVERQSVGSDGSSTTGPVPGPPSQLSEDEVQQLDQDCMERFIKLKVKHITDGQGVVKGTLLVTPNAVMFDPDVSDPLVIEHGCERYGMIAPMDLIISAAMYHDIAAMKLRGQKHGDESVHPKPEVYHDTSCPLYMARHPDTCNKQTPDDEEGPSVTPVTPHLTHQESVCSCGVGADMESFDLQNSPHQFGEVFTSLTKDAEREKDNVARDGDNKAVSSCDIVSDNVFTDKTSPENRHEHVRKLPPKPSVTFDLPDEDNESEKHSTSVTDAQKVQDEGHVEKNQDQTESDKSEISKDIHMPNDNIDEDSDDKAVINITEEKVSDNQTRIGSIVYLPVKDDTSGKVSLESLEDSQNTLSKMSNVEFEKASKSDSNLSESIPPTENQEITKVRSASTSSLGPFSPSPHLSAFVNYATGFFQKTASDTCIKDIKDVITDEKLVTRPERSASDVPVVSSVPMPSRQRGKLSRHHNSGVQDKVEVESAVSFDEKSDLFSMDYDRFMIRQSTSAPNPPLYLCLKLGTPLNRNVFHNYSIESYGKRHKKSEYWFSIPRDRVDHLYAFFVQWTPDIYGDDDEVDPEKRGFVVVPEGDRDVDDDFDVMDEHFGPNSAFQKDWEIISKEEAFKRRSIVFEEPIPLPDLIGESTILKEEHIFQVSQILPGRTVGYPWTLVYSTDHHGFSLKTLYRGMTGLDCPVLLVVKDTADNVFGALTSCELKLSDHFYGTGETFLYTFYPKFQVFNWTGENNFFMKGHKDGLSIGASQGVFGLWFDGDLYHGRTHACETFDNDILTVSEDFIVKAFEAWSFTDDY